MDFRLLVNIIFPPRCVACRTEVDQGAICEPCRAAVRIAPAISCPLCGQESPSRKLACHPFAPFVIMTAGRYHDPVLRELIRHLKFHNVRDAAIPIAKILVDAIQNIPMNPMQWVIAPIPLSARRRRERGYNQSELIAAGLSATAGIPMHTDLIRRIRHRSPQSDLDDSAARAENIKDCYHADTAKIKEHPSIILLDDVTTSGATFMEAARALANAGAKEIIALAAAKA